VAQPGLACPWLQATWPAGKGPVGPVLPIGNGGRERRLPRWRKKVARPRFQHGGASPTFLICGGGVLQHEGVEGSEAAVAMEREGAPGWSSPRRGWWFRRWR
jgi:hypothetical protein